MTLRENTERPVTVTEGTNRLVHITTEDILKNYREIRNNEDSYSASVPRLWDGKAAERIARIIAEM
jgi:UDP-N-acetylglucosamine 2-epimerase (non-hydrolysing)